MKLRNSMKKIRLEVLLVLALIIPVYKATAQPGSYATIGQVIRNDPKINQLIPADAKIEIIAAGFEHLEGPVWVKDPASGSGGYLLVNDTKAQITYKWSPGAGLSKFIGHTGYTGPLPYSDEPGSNGMTVDRQGRLIVCDHGDRRVATLPLRNKSGKQTLTDAVQGKRYNSPNDVIAHSDGSLFFSDPPYGLPLREKDPARELSVNGVYRLSPAGQVSLVIGDMNLPNGLALSPDEKTLYVTQSDSLHPVINAYLVLANGLLGKKRLFFDGSVLPKVRYKEVLDGIKVDRVGNCWVAGPGGLLILSPAGKLLGRIDTGEVIANCAWGNDGSTLYIASGMFCAA